MSSNLPGVDPTTAAENARLRARIEALEAELAAMRTREARAPRSDSERRRRDVQQRAADEGTRVLRACAEALAERLRATADVVSAVADEAIRRRDERASAERSAGERPATAPPGDGDTTGPARAGRAADDLAAIVDIAIERAVEIPGRVIERMSDAYRGSR